MENTKVRFSEVSLVLTCAKGKKTGNTDGQTSLKNCESLKKEQGPSYPRRLRGLNNFCKMFRGRRNPTAKPEIMRDAYKALLIGSGIAISGCSLLILTIRTYFQVSTVSNFLLCMYKYFTYLYPQCRELNQKLKNIFGTSS